MYIWMGNHSNTTIALTLCSNACCILTFLVLNMVIKSQILRFQQTPFIGFTFPFLNGIQNMGGHRYSWANMRFLSCFSCLQILQLQLCSTVSLAWISAILIISCSGWNCGFTWVISFLTWGSGEFCLSSPLRLKKVSNEVDYRFSYTYNVIIELHT